MEDILRDEEDRQCGWEHEEAVVSHQAVLADLLGLQLLLDDDPITSSEEVVEEHIYIT